MKKIKKFVIKLIKKFRKLAKNKKLLLIIIIGILILATISYYFFNKQNESKNESKNNLPTIGNVAAPKTYLYTNTGCEKVKTTNTPILMYHHIAINDQPKNQTEIDLHVSPDNFRSQMNYLKSQNYKTINLSDIFCKSFDKNVAITIDDGYKDNITNALPILKSFGYKATLYVITNDVGKPDYLTWDDINTLKNAGWEIGSHTLTHPDLSILSQASAKNQIFESKQILETKLNIVVSSFCYPSGKYNTETLSLVKQANYLYAVNTKIGKTHSLSDPFQLTRIRVHGPETLTSFISSLPK
jgi:peptidoglycan/xylan/chitin deacetylase (PgdA/CDA1 family)